MASSLSGSYVETCSWDLICPCYASFDHGVTNDYCRASFGFVIREGEIDGTDVSGLNGDHCLYAVADGELAEPTKRAPVPKTYPQESNRG